MTKQPVLTNFPSTIIATAKRRLQASIREFRASVIRDSLSGYSVLFADVLPRSFFTAIDPTERQRSFGHVPVFWAWMAQILEGNASCQRALGLLQAWYQVLWALLLQLEHPLWGLFIKTEQDQMCGQH